MPGARLYLEVRGARPDAPVLVWLHGGPGGAERPLFRLFDSDLERDFRVAYFDQRGAGRSVAEGSAQDLTIDRHVADLHAVIARLKRELGAERVILVGHSWGSLLGMLYASRYPEDVAAFVGVSQVVAPLEDQREHVRFATAEAKRRGDRHALDKIGSLGAPPLSGLDDLALGRLVEEYGGTWHQDPHKLGALARAIVSGLISPFQLSRFIEANEHSLAVMTPELLHVDLRNKVPAAKVPVVFFLGAYDHQIDARLAIRYAARLRAPGKELRLFRGSAHNIPFEEPKAFCACLRLSLDEVERRPVPRQVAAHCPYPDRFARTTGDAGAAG